MTFILKSKNLAPSNRNLRLQTKILEDSYFFDNGLKKEKKIMVNYNKANVYGGSVEFKMPEAMAKSYLESRSKSDKKMEPKEYLIKVVNEEFGLKGRCVNVITF